MLLGTFKTVFNSVFLVPTKTNTLHHKATVERQESERQTERSAQRQTDPGNACFKILCPWTFNRPSPLQPGLTPPWMYSIRLRVDGYLLCGTHFHINTGCDQATDKAALELFVSVRVKAAAGGPDKWRNGSHVTQDSTYKYGRDHRGT